MNSQDPQGCQASILENKPYVLVLSFPFRLTPIFILCLFPFLFIRTSIRSSLMIELVFGYND